MPYPTTKELYAIAAKLGPVDADIVNAAADELLERRTAMMIHDAEICKLRTALRVNIIRLSPQVTHAQIDELINSL